MPKKPVLTPINKVVPIDKISPHEQNYNSHPDVQLKKLGQSVRELGQFRSLVLWEQPDGGYIQLAGHGVVEAMKREGATEVRADVFDISLDAMTAKQIMLADNLHAQNSEIDTESLVTLLQEQQDLGYDLASLGTDEESLRQMLENLGDELLGSSNGDKMSEPGDAETSDVAEQWGIIVECRSEEEQLELLERFQEENISCRALVL